MEGNNTENTISVREALQQAVVFLKNKQPRQAEQLCGLILQTAPEDVNALNLLGTAFSQQGRFESAVRQYQKALALQPNSAELHFNCATALDALERYEKAAEHYARTLHINPKHIGAQINLGINLRHRDLFDDAVETFNKALELDPRQAKALNNRGIALDALGRHEEAIANYEAALALMPDYPEALTNRGIALEELGRNDEAIASHRKALTLNPTYGLAHYNLGVSLQIRGDSIEAITHFQKTINLQPDHYRARVALGNAFFGISHYDEAIETYRQAVELQPDKPHAYAGSGAAYCELKKYDEAIASCEKALELDPENIAAANALSKVYLTTCNWQGAERTLKTAKLRDFGIDRSVPPFSILLLSDDPAEQLACAKYAAPSLVVQSGQAPTPNPVGTKDLIRIAYLSPDFRNHPLGQCTARIFECHDRERFETHALSYGPDTQDPMRKRMENAFDKFHDIRFNDNQEVAELIRDLGIHIAVDLAGYTTFSRTEILAHRPAPIQVNYLGFPGTLGTEVIDYILTDEYVAPTAHQSFFSEKLVHLPNTYIINEPYKVTESLAIRAECGLPEKGFVFCCFNNPGKITAEIFDVWMRLLRSKSGSVLWLIRGSETAERNLHSEAVARGIDPGRLVFAPKVDLEPHLARHAHVDLFLDTFPYNAHTTALDALQSGTPIVTYSGRSFQSRVAGSLLHTIGLPELVTDSLEEYEATALALAQDPERLDSYRQRLLDNRYTSPVFDIERFTRNLEQAYETMVERWQAGQPPQPFSVADVGPT